MKKRPIIFFIVLTLLISFGVYYLFSNEPDDVTKSFYKEWIKQAESSNLMGGRLYAQNKYVTTEFISTMDSIEPPEEEWIDPVLCSQSIPRSISTVITEKNSMRAVVKVILFFEEGTKEARVRLSKDGSSWKVDEVLCENIKEPDTTDNFKKEGYLTQNEDGDWSLAYDNEEIPEIIAKLSFTTNSRCVEKGIRTLCLSSFLQQGMRVDISGMEVEEGLVEVGTLSMVPIESIQGTLINIQTDRARLIILPDGGLEVITVTISSSTSIYDFENEKIFYESLPLGSSVVIRGIMRGGRFEAHEIRVLSLSNLFDEDIFDISEEI